MTGRRADDIRTELVVQGMSGPELDAAVARACCPGNRASTMLLMPELSAYRLGQLLAMYEHRTFVEAMLYGINPFDEFGVEYGRTLAGPIARHSLRADCAARMHRRVARRPRALTRGTHRGVEARLCGSDQAPAEPSLRTHDTSAARPDLRQRAFAPRRQVGRIRFEALDPASAAQRDSSRSTGGSPGRTPRGST
jgi:hypothetical protein